MYSIKTENREESKRAKEIRIDKISHDDHKKVPDTEATKYEKHSPDHQEIKTNTINKP